MDQAAPQIKRPGAIDRRARETAIIGTRQLLPELGTATELRHAALARFDRRYIFLPLVEFRFVDFLAVRQPRPGLLRHLGDEHRLEADVAVALLGKNTELGRLVGVQVTAVQEREDAVIMV